MKEALLFGSTFATVFALGLQSLNVNRGHRFAAFLTSFLIGGGNLVVLKLIPGGGWTEVAAYMVGGPFGIIASMAAHPWLVARGRRADQAHDTKRP